jgi:CHASE2 domain-containing sensor protein
MGRKQSRNIREGKRSKQPSRNLLKALLRAKAGKVLAVILFCTGVVFFASWVGLFDLLKIDSWVERKFITYTDAFTYEDIHQDVVLITAGEDAQANGSLGKPDQTWRRYHAELLDALARAKAKAVAFDLYFEDSSANDREFGEAIKRATESGTTVVIGVRQFNVQEGAAIPFLTPALQGYLGERNWGFLDVGGVDKDTVSVRKLRLAADANAGLPSWVEAQESKVVPSFTLQVLRAGLSAQTAVASYDRTESSIRLRADTGRVVKSIPVDEALNFIVDEKETAALDKINHPYQEVYNNLNNADYLRNFFGGRIVIVGYKDKEDLRTVTKGESRYGVQIQANAVSDLLQGIYISKLRATSNLLFIAVISAVGFLLGSRFRHHLRYKIPIEFSIVKTHLDFPLLPFLAAVAYLFLAVLLYKSNRVLLGIPYHLAVLFLTFWLAAPGAVRKRGRST